MSNKEHSPIPWQLEGYEKSSIYTTDSHTWLVASCYNTPLPTEIERANAEFIVTACNNHESLLAALRLAAPELCSNLCPTVWLTSEPQPHSETCMRLRAAIAKAESGEQVGRTPLPDMSLMDAIDDEAFRESDLIED